MAGIVSHVPSMAHSQKFQEPEGAKGRISLTTFKEAFINGNATTLCQRKFLKIREPVLRATMLSKYQMKDMDIIFPLINLSFFWVK